MTDIQLKEGVIFIGESAININSISSVSLDKQQVEEMVPTKIARKLIKPEYLAKSKRKKSSISGLVILCVAIVLTVYWLPSTYVNDRIQTSLYWCSPFLLYSLILIIQSVYFKVSAYSNVQLFIKNLNDEFILTITTSSGEKKIIKDQDLSNLTTLRDSIISQIESIANKVVNFNLVSDTVTINNETRNFNTSYIYGDQIIQNINNYDLALTNADKEFLKNDFQNALTHIYKEILDQNNQEIKKRFDEIRTELNSKKPQKTKLVSIFSMIKGLSTASDFIEAANTVMQGINLLG